MSDPVKDKDKLYRLIIGQLQFDGYIQVSKNLAQQGKPRNSRGVKHLFQISAAKPRSDA